MNKKEAYKIVFEDLKTHSLFMGKYDAKNGNPHFMYGVATVMEFIANNISEKTYFDFYCTWTQNMVESEERKRKNKYAFAKLDKMAEELRTLLTFSEEGGF